MPVATPDQYAAMLDAAKSGAFAFPAVNVSSSQTLNAALQGFSEAGSDGIIQVSFGGADYFAGQSVQNRVGGAIAFAKYAEEVAKAHDVTVAPGSWPRQRATARAAAVVTARPALRNGGTRADGVA